MDVAKLVLEYLQALLWPTIVIIALLVFREQLQSLITNLGTAVHRLTKFTAPGTTVELISGLSESTDQVIPTESPKKGLGRGVGALMTEPQDESLDDLTMGKIVRIWAEIDAALVKLVEMHFPEPKDHRYRRVINPHRATSELSKNGIISPDIAHNLTEARTIRGQVVHGKETIPLGSFDDYLVSITKLRDYLEATIELI